MGTGFSLLSSPNHRSLREDSAAGHRHYHPYQTPPYTPAFSPTAPHHHHKNGNHLTSTQTSTSTTPSSHSTLRTHNGHLYPVRPLSRYNNNTGHSNGSTPVPLAPLQRHVGGDQVSHRSEYIGTPTGGSSSPASVYYPHSNLRPVTPSQGYSTHSSHYPPISPAKGAAAPQGGPSTTTITPKHHGHQMLQPLRPHNGPRPMSSAQPLVPRNAYARTPAPRPAVGNDENAPPTQALPSDKHMLRSRLAARGVSIDNTTRIGSGRYSKVMTASLKDGGTIAIKVINIARVTNEFRTKFLPREIECWERLRHANLVKLLSRDEIAGRVFLFMEYGRGGDMLAHVQKHGPVAEDAASLWMRQVVEGLSYMHEQGIVHRDLKLENIIIFSPSCVKIADFGFARTVEDEASTTYCGSKSYSAPEILSGQPYNPYKADVWSIGVITYVVVTDRMPFKDSMPNSEIINAQRKRLYAYPPQLNLSPAFRSAIDSLLVFDAQTRPDVGAVARIGWFVHAEARPRLPLA